MRFEHNLRYLTDKSWQDPRLHFHDNYEFLFSLTEAGSIFAHNEVFPLSEGSLFFFTPGILHRTACDVEQFERYVLHIPEATFTQLQEDHIRENLFSGSHRCVITGGEEYRHLRELFDRLYELERQEEESGMLINITFLELLYQLYYLFSHSSQSGEPVPRRELDRIRPIMEYLQDHIAEPITLDDISEHFYINKHYVCHLFKKATNFTISEFIIKNRLAIARRLLRDGCSVQETSERCGFQSYTHFIRSFSKDMGISPGKYAREYQVYKKI